LIPDPKWDQSDSGVLEVLAFGFYGLPRDVLKTL
jgi:hypothetical protein